MTFISRGDFSLKLGLQGVKLLLCLISLDERFFDFTLIPIKKRQIDGRSESNMRNLMLHVINHANFRLWISHTFLQMDIAFRNVNHGFGRLNITSKFYRLL